MFSDRFIAGLMRSFGGRGPTLVFLLRLTWVLTCDNLPPPSPGHARE